MACTTIWCLINPGQIVRGENVSSASVENFLMIVNNMPSLLALVISMAYLHPGERRSIEKAITVPLGSSLGIPSRGGKGGKLVR